MDNPAERQKLNQTTETNDSTVAGNSRTSFLHPKGFVPIIVLVLVVLTIALGGFYLVRSQKSTLKSQNTKIVQQPPQSPSLSPLPSTETANWKTYTNTTYNFSIKYPDAWYIGEQQNVIYVNNAPIPSIPLTHGLPSSLQISIYTSPQDIPNPIWKHKTEKTTLGGISATRVTDQEAGGLDDIARTTIVINSGKISYVLVFANTDINGGHNPVFDQILSTFKFTDQTQTTLGNSAVPVNGKEARFAGIITNVNQGCHVDNTCSIQLDNKSWITYEAGSTPEMLSDHPPKRGRIIGMNFSTDSSQYIGKKVEVYGAKVSNENYTIYGSSQYYIKLIE